MPSDRSGVDAARGLQHPAHFQRPDGHHYQIGLHPLAMRLACGFDDGVSGGVPVSQFAMLAHVHIIQAPCVLERGTGCLASYRGLVVSIAVERRIEIDQVTAGVVHATHDGEVVARPDRPLAKLAVMELPPRTCGPLRLIYAQPQIRKKPTVVHDRMLVAHAT